MVAMGLPGPVKEAGRAGTEISQNAGSEGSFMQNDEGRKSEEPPVMERVKGKRGTSGRGGGSGAAGNEGFDPSRQQARSALLPQQKALVHLCLRHWRRQAGVLRETPAGARGGHCLLTMEELML